MPRFGDAPRSKSALIPLCTMLTFGCVALALTFQQALAESADDQPAVAATDGPRQPGLPTLNAVVITATRSQALAFDLPYATESISAQQISRNLYRTMPEALRDLPAVMVQKTSHGQGSPYIRGFTGFHNLLLIDGIRLNNSVFRNGPNQYWNTVDPFTIDRLEVIKGPNSVLYGSDAIGGTINAITKNPDGYSPSGEGFGVAGRGYYRVSTAENSHIGRGEVSFGFDNHTGIRLGLTGKHFGDLIGGDDIGRQPDTGYDEYDADFKAEHFLNPDTRLVVAHQRVRQNNVPRTHKTISAKSFVGTTVGNELQRDLDQERQLTYIQLHAENLDGPIDTLRLSLSHQRQSETRHRIRPPSGGGPGPNRVDFQGFDVDTLGFGAQLTSQSSFGLLTYGVEYYHDNVNSFSTGNTIQGPVADDATYDLLGVYIQDQFDITDTVGIILGGRFTYARANANAVRDPVTKNQITVTDDWTAFVGSARFVIDVIPEHVNLFGGVSQGFRSPNLSDLTRFDSARTNEFEVAAPGLNPEHYISYEVGLKARSEAASAQVTYFYTDIQDQILRFPTGNTNGSGEFEVTKANVGDGQVFGVELGAAWVIHPQWTLFGNVAYIEGQVTNFPDSTSPIQSQYLSRLMPLTGQVGLRWDAPEGRGWVQTVVVFADDADKLSRRDVGDTQRIPPGGTPGYVVWHIRGGWRVNDQVEITVALENVLDKDYRVHGSGQNEAGRNLIIGTEITF